MEIGHELLPLTEQRLSDIEESWTGIAGTDEFEAEMSVFFDWCSRNLDPNSPDGHALELRNKQTGQAVALLEMINATQRRQSKLLRLVNSPAYWNADADPDLHQEFRVLHAAAYTLLLSDGMARDLQSIKIYGRSTFMLNILTKLAQNWAPELTGWRATMQGRWLEISRASTEGHA